MAQKTTKPDGLKISELAKRAGVPIPTIKHYLNEGLLPKPIKTGRTMSYYDNECVEKVRLIKRLSTERFFPLAVIKRIIESGGSLDGELALGEALLNAPPVPAPADVVPRKEIARCTGYSLPKIDRMESLGLISPRKTSHGKEYDPVDCQVISLVRQREEAGLPFDYSLEMMTIYRRHIQDMVKDDAKLFVRRMLRNSSASDAARYIREGDRALGAFMLLIKARLVKAHAKNLIETLNFASGEVRESLRFRMLPGARVNEGRFAPSTGTTSRFQAMFAEAVQRNRRFTLEAGEENTEWGNLLLGLNDLANGRVESALLRLNRASASRRVGLLAAALHGLAHLGQIADVPGVLSPMHRVSEAMESFDASRHSMPDRTMCLLVSYFRGVGLAIIPDIFDTHQAAADDLSRLIGSGFATQSREEDSGRWKKVGWEIGLKASYFLARMYLQDGQRESAEKVLSDMAKKGESSFYGKWACKRLLETSRVAFSNKARGGQLADNKPVNGLLGSST